MAKRSLLFYSALSLVVASTVAGCTKPKQTTAIGSATGGIVGAGLGAIVGNQTGNAGNGLAIGAVAGAATGALIGNALQAQQETAQSQDEALERQDRLIQAQRQEIDELRAIQSDPPVAVPSSRSHYLPSPSQHSLSPEAARKLAQLERRGPAPRPAAAAAPLRTDVEPRGRYQGAAKPAAAKRAAKAPVVQQETTEVIETTVEERAGGTSMTETDIVEVESSTTSGLAPSSQQEGSCAEAAGEDQSAQAASEISQKLYHLRRAQRLCPGNANYHAELGEVYLAMGRNSDAQYEFREALKKNPGLQSAKNGIERAKSSPPEKF